MPATVHAPPATAVADPPVVMHLLPTLATGGAEMMVLRVQERVRRRGRYAPLICTLRDGGTLLDAFRAQGLPVLVLGLPRRSLFSFPAFLYDVTRLCLAIRRAMRAHGVRLLQSHLPDADLLALAVGRLTGVPTVLTHQSSQLIPVRRRPGLRLSLRRWLVRRLYRHADALIAVSPTVTEMLTTQARVPEANISLIFNAVDAPGKASAAARAAARKVFGVAEGEYVILCTARLVANKGQAYLVDALPHLPADVGPVHVIFIGEGDDREALETRARAIPAPHRVTFLGLRADAVDLLAGADLFCLPSLREGQSLALLEALARQVPVVATRAPGIRDTLADGRHALLVPPEDAPALADGIAQLARDPAQAARLAVAGYAFVAERYSLDSAAERTEALYARLLNGRARR